MLNYTEMCARGSLTLSCTQTVIRERLMMKGIGVLR